MDDTTVHDAWTRLCAAQSKEVIVERQYVSAVHEFSSQYGQGDSNWGAVNIVGPPRVYPEYSDNRLAWASQSHNAQEYVVVEFTKACVPTKMEIYETLGAGALVKVSGRVQGCGDWVTLWSSAPDRSKTSASRIFEIFLEGHKGQAFSVFRLDTDSRGWPTWYEIDAIALTGTTSGCVATVPSVLRPKSLAADLNALLESQTGDVVFKTVDGKQVKAHSSILLARCPSMLKSRDTVVIAVRDRIDVLRLVLKFLYTDTADVPVALCVPVYVAASRWGLEDLAHAATTTFAAMLTLNNVFDMLSFVDGMVDLQLACSDFLVRHPHLLTAPPPYTDGSESSSQRAPASTAVSSLTREQLVQLVQQFAVVTSLKKIVLRGRLRRHRHDMSDDESPTQRVRIPSARTPVQRAVTPALEQPPSSRDREQGRAGHEGSSTTSKAKTHSDTLLTSLAELTNATWYMSKVSSMYNFKYDMKSIRTYAKSCSASMEIMKAGGVQIHSMAESSEARSHRVTIEILKGISLFREEADSVMFTVNTLSTDPDMKTRQVFKAILLSVGNEAKAEEDFVTLPVLLTKGSKSLRKLFFDWLQLQFDCTVSTMYLKPLDLAWMASEWATPDAGAPVDVKKPFELTYKPNASIQGLDRVTMTIPADGIRLLHSKVVAASGGGRLSGQELLRCLEDHFYHHYHIHLSAMSLCRVATYATNVDADGRIKLVALPTSMAESSLFVLQYLTYVALRK